MRQITKTLYKYDELPSERAKERARQWYLDAFSGDDWSWENTVEDARQIGLVIKSLDPHRRNIGGFEKSALDTAERILKDHGDSSPTYKTAAKYLERLKTFQEDDDNESISEFLRDILEDYRALYQMDREYQESEEFIADSMAANEYEFDEDGRRTNG